MQRPVEKYSLGIHHLAQPTLDPAATLDFYVGTMGAEITHCISSRGWRTGHVDYIHMFLELDSPESVERFPDNIAMFYYFGAKTESDWPKYGTHHSFAAASIAELDEWEAWLKQKGYEIVWRAEYEIMTSLYVVDPNGRVLEIAAQHRTLNEVDAEDGRLTAEALVLAAAESAGSIADLWRHKARLVEEGEGAVEEPIAYITPRVAEFESLTTAAVEGGGNRVDRENFSVVSAAEELTISRPGDISEAVWWGVGTGGVKGTITQFDEERLVISA